MAKKKRNKTSTLGYLQKRYIREDPQRLASLEEERLNARIAQTLFDLRKAAGLTQKQLAELAGTTDTVISRLEDSDYEGHSLSMIRRIAAALHHRVELHFVPEEDELTPTG